MKPCLALAATLALATGCSKTNANYCASAPDHNCSELIDAHGSGMIDSAAGCGSAADCAGTSTPVCNDQHVCVACDSANLTACPAATPVCNTAMDTCRPCATHAECGSPGACLPDGSCGTDANTAWVAPNGSGNACTQAAPCGTITAALATNRAYIKVASGMIMDQPTIGRDVTILSETNSKVAGMGAGPVVTVSGSSNVTIHDLAIINGLGPTGDGLFVNAGQSPSVTLERVSLTGNGARGIYVLGGNIAANRCNISSNNIGGVSINASSFAITNSFITRNGNTTNGTGGAALNASDAAHAQFEFNTVIDNNLPPTTLQSGGVTCDISGFAAPNNIIARNYVNGSTTATNANTVGQCTYPTSVIETTVTDLHFLSADATPYNYHLAAGSVAIDQATTASAIDTDFDGDHRPQGAQKDQGADEYE